MSPQKPAARWLLGWTLPGKTRNGLTRHDRELRKIKASLPFESRQKSAILADQGFFGVNRDLRAGVAHLAHAV